MEALLVLFMITLALVALAVMSAVHGVDSRDGIGDDRLRSSLR